MEQVKTAVDGALDLLRQESQGKQTGLEVETCEIHGCKLTIPAGLIFPVCFECEKEKNFRKDVDRAHGLLNLPPRFSNCSFDTYIPKNKKSAEAKKICQDYAINHDNSGGLIMVGGVGTGKTHLAIAMCKAVCDRGISAKITTISRMIRKIRSSWVKNSNETEEAIIMRYSEWYNFLVIDEIGSQYGSESEKITISEIVNDRYNNNLPTVILGNVTIKEAEQHLGGRVIDRIKDNGKIIVFDWESHRRLSK